jgi:Protein of unknown function (DUF3618)
VAEDPSAIRQAISEVRSDMAETIDALGQKADVKARGVEKLNEAKGQAKAKAAEVGDRMRQALPEQARPRVATVVDQAKSTTSTVGGIVRERPMVVAGAVVVIAAILLRRRRNRRRET